MKPRVFSYLTGTRQKLTSFPSYSRVIPGIGSVLHPRRYFIPLQTSEKTGQNYDTVVNDPKATGLVKVDENPLEKSQNIVAKKSKEAKVARKRKNTKTPQKNKKVKVSKKSTKSKKHPKKVAKRKKSAILSKPQFTPSKISRTDIN